MSLRFGSNAWSKSDIYNINNNINEEKEKQLNGRKKLMKKKKKNWINWVNSSNQVNPSNLGFTS
jgi:hypothetical protein